MGAARVREPRAVGDGTVHDPQEGALAEHVRAVLDRHRQAGARKSEDHDSEGSGGPVWDVRVDDLWCTATPRARELPPQGWKIHVSAATHHAVAVLDRVCDIVVPRGVAFKCAADTQLLHMLNSRESDRSSSGKFITVYPHDDAGFTELADALDAATRGFVGPGIMSDRLYRPGGIVHYRYGGFTGQARLGNDGAYRPVLTAPDGTEVEDSREAWFAPPAWAPDPLAGTRTVTTAQDPGTASSTGRPPAAAAGGTGSAGGGGVSVAGRFSVSAAIRHSAKGGVFVGTDTVTGADVVVKQARAHIEVDHSGRDAHAALRHESELLLRLGDTGLTPRHVALVE
ncbi:MAG TPA: hypothetical protein VLH10_20370 [Yinghuangia sp.]|nr:hypothetical protein [Yinghuangia sp.]